MDSTILIKGRKVCVKPTRTRIEAIQRLNPPTTPKGCRSFAGVVNIPSLLCPEPQKVLKLIYDLTRKGRVFLWQTDQEAFDEIKRQAQEPPILYMSDNNGRFHLYSDTSKFATGSALYQIQNGQPKLIAYASKRMLRLAQNYFITKIELCGLAINIASFSQLLKRVDFYAVVADLSLTHIMKSKSEQATNWIKMLLDIWHSYTFNLYYLKGKDVAPSDFLLWMEGDQSDPQEIIPLSFNSLSI